MASSEKTPRGTAETAMPEAAPPQGLGPRATVGSQEVSGRSRSCSPGLRAGLTAWLPSGVSEECDDAVPGSVEQSDTGGKMPPQSNTSVESKQSRETARPACARVVCLPTPTPRRAELKSRPPAWPSPPSQCSGAG